MELGPILRAMLHNKVKVGLLVAEIAQAELLAQGAAWSHPAEVEALGLDPDARPGNALLRRDRGRQRQRSGEEGGTSSHGAPPAARPPGVFFGAVSRRM